MQWTPTDAPLRIPDAATAPWTVAVGADDRQPRRPFSAPQAAALPPNLGPLPLPLSLHRRAALIAATTVATVVVMLAAEPAHATSVAGVTMAASRGSQLVDVWQREASLRAQRRGAAAQLEESSMQRARARGPRFREFFPIECPAWTKNEFLASTASLRLGAEVPAGQRTLVAVPRSQ